MWKSLLAIAAILWLATVSPALAALPVHMAVTLERQPSCARGVRMSDGCAQAGGGNFIRPNFSTYARQSGQSWSSDHPEAFNLPGADYRNGYRLPDGALKDPTTAKLPPGCDVETSTLGGPDVECYNAPSLVFSGYDFSLHGCVPLRIHNSVTGQIVLVDNKHKNGANCSRTDAVAQGYMGDQFTGYITGTTLCVQGSPALGSVESGDPSDTLTDTLSKVATSPAATYITAVGQGTQPCQAGETAYTVNQSQTAGSTSSPLTIQEKSDHMTITSMVSGTIQNNDYAQGGVVIGANTMVSGGSGGTGTYTMTRYWFDPGSTYTFGMDQGYLVTVDNGSTASVMLEHSWFDADGGNLPMSLNAVAYLDNSGDLDVQYDVFLHSPSRPISGATFGKIAIKHNFFEDFVYNTVDGHREIFVNGIGTGTSKSFVNSYNVALAGADMPYVAAGGPALIWLGGGGATTTYAYVQADHNVGIANCAGGACTGNNLNISAMFEIQASTYTTLNLTSNFADMTGGLFSSAAYASGTPTCTTPTHWFGNTLLTGGTFGAWYPTTATGC